jgi:hypothetical protein
VRPLIGFSRKNCLWHHSGDGQVGIVALPMLKPTHLQMVSRDWMIAAYGARMAGEAYGSA